MPVHASGRIQAGKKQAMSETLAGIPTLLIIDDVPSNLTVMVESLENCGYRVVAARDGEEGLQYAAFVQFDLVLLDVMMPGMDGFDVCRRLKSDPRTADIPVIFMTALTDTKHKIAAFKAGGVDYVTKPVQVDEVIARVGTHLNLRFMRRQLQIQNVQLHRHQVELEHRVAERTVELSASNRLLREEIDERRRTQERLALVDFALNQVSEAVYLIDENARFHYVNDEACRVLGYGRETLSGMGIGDVDPGWLQIRWPKYYRKLKRQGSFMLETQHRACDGRVLPVEVSANYFEYDGVGYNLLLVRDITERKRQEAQDKSRRRIFELLARGGKLPEILGLVVRYVEQACPDCIGSIMLLDAKGTHLRSTAAPNLPQDYLAAIDGIAAADGVGSCGTAAWRKETVIVEDIRSHPYWVLYKHFALQAGLLSCWSEPIFDFSGKVLGTFGIYRREAVGPSQGDLELLRRVSYFAAIAIERRQIEERLQASERDFRSLAENSPDIIVRYDRDCRRVYFNRAYLGAVGISASDALGKTPLECWWSASPSAEEYSERLQWVIDTGEADELLAERVDREGLQANYTVALVPEFDEGNRVVSVLTISHDITGIKRMEAMLRKSELEFRTLAENSPEMIVRYDRDYRRIYINPAYDRETGIPLEIAWSKTPHEVWKPLMPAEEYVAWLKRVMETGESGRILLEWHGQDDSLVSHNMHAVAEYDEDGQVIGALVIGHNITELKATERRLEESRVQLRALAAKREEAREEERKHIAREIHDELGQLLNVLRLNVTTLDFRFGDANPELRDKAQKMVGTVDRAILMVRSLATRLRPAALRGGIVSALEWLVQEYAESTGIVCRLHVPADDDIALDETRAMAVFRIVQESLTNVLRHSGADRVDITLSSAAGICEVEVHDNGKGFAPGSAGRVDSYGIIGMQERALILKGSLDIAAAEVGGTALKLRIPIDDSHETGMAPKLG